MRGNTSKRRAVVAAILVRCLPGRLWMPRNHRALQHNWNQGNSLATMIYFLILISLRWCAPYFILKLLYGVFVVAGYLQSKSLADVL